MTAKHDAINDEMMLENVTTLADKLNLENLQYSRGWLSRFILLHDLNKGVYQGEADSANK